MTGNKPIGTGVTSTPTMIDGYHRKDGTYVGTHLAPRRRKAVAPSEAQPSLFDRDASGSPLNGFIAKHGGPAHLKASLAKMSAEQRAKLIDAMANLGGIRPAEVIAKLGLGGEVKSVAPNDPEIDVGERQQNVDVSDREHSPEQISPPSKDYIADYFAHGDAKKKPIHVILDAKGAVVTWTAGNLATAEASGKYYPDDGMVVVKLTAKDVTDAGGDVSAALKAKTAAAKPAVSETNEAEKPDDLPVPEVRDGGIIAAHAEPATDDEPADGDTKTEDGIEYVLRDGRWHRAHAEPEIVAPTHDPEVEAIEDRQDLSEAMARDPHSEETKLLLRKVAAKELPPVEASGDDLDPSSPNYRYRDTGYIAGSRKELAEQMIRRMSRAGTPVRATDIDWESLEQNPRQANELITKSNLFGDVDWTEVQANGTPPAAAFVASKVYAAVPSRPTFDTEGSRHDYAVALDTIRDRIGSCRSVAEITDVLDQMRSERDGSELNEQESALYARVKDVYIRESERARALETQAEDLSKRAMTMSAQIYKYEHEINNRRKRGWEPKPDIEKLASDMKAEQAAAYEVAAKFRADNGMNAVTHQTKTETSLSARFEYPYRADIDKASAAMRAIKDHAKARNATENQMTRAWLSLGDQFGAVLDYRSSYRGSAAFAKHVATAKSGRITDWSWAESSRTPREATKQSTSFQLHVADSFERTGGRAVDVGSTGDLKREFHLREVQSGNWVLDDPNSAKFHVESCAGAFADLADIIGVGDGDVSFHGRLAMSFGARGKGKAKAHYEPIQRVINITKMAGGGSLAHEWFHCVDNLVKEATTGIPSSADDFATENAGIIDHPELHIAFRDLTSAMMAGHHRRVETLTYTEAEEKWAAQNMSGRYGRVRGDISAAKDAQSAADAVDRLYEAGAFGQKDKRKSQSNRDNWRKIALIHHGANADRKIVYSSGSGMSSFLLDAIELDQGQSGKYWSSPHEMAARAFSSYVEDRLAAEKRSNTYLVSDANNEVYRRLGEPHRPFPENAERERVNSAFNRLFEIMRKENVLEKAFAVTDVGV